MDDERVDVNVAVIDVGLDLDNPDLNIVDTLDCLGANESNEFTCESDSPDDGDIPVLGFYETHAYWGAAIGAIDNGFGGVGEAPGARLWGLRTITEKDYEDRWAEKETPVRLAADLAALKWVLSTRTDDDPTNDIDVVIGPYGGVGYCTTGEGAMPSDAPEFFWNLVCPEDLEGPLSVELAEVAEELKETGLPELGNTGGWGGERNEGEYLSQFGSAGSGDGQFAYPGAPSLDAEGDIWVTDVLNNRLEKFDSDGTFLAKFGTNGSGNGQLDTPIGTAIDSSGNIWVVDTGNNRVQKFNSKGEYLSQFGTKGSGNGQFDDPRCIAIDAEGNLWVTDYANSRVQKFNSKGEYLSQFGSSGSGAGEFNGPIGIAADSGGHLWVADNGNDRVQEFSLTGAFMTQIGEEGSGEGQFDGPAGVAVNSAGSAWITDTGNNRVQELFNRERIGTVIRASGMIDTDGIPGGKAPDFLGNNYPECRFPYGESVYKDDRLSPCAGSGTAVDIAGPDGPSVAMGYLAGAVAILASETPTDSPEDIEEIRSTLIEAGNYDWIDDSGDGVKEPLLDLHDEEVFDPKTIAGNDSPATDSDVNGDGGADLVTLRANGIVYVHPGGEDAKFGSGVTSFSDGEGGGTLDPAQYDGKGNYVIDVSDVDGDGRSDLVTLTDDGDVHVYAGESDATFDEEGAVSELELTPALLKSGGYEPIAAADTSGDGYADLIAYDDRLGALMIYPGDSEGTFAEGIEARGALVSALHTGTGHYFIDAADVTGDNRADLVSMTSTGDLVTFIGRSNWTLSTGTVSHKGEIDPAMNDGEGYEPVGVGDITGDDKADLTLVKAGTVYVYPGTGNGYYEGLGDGSFGTATTSFGGGATSTTFGTGGACELFGPIDVSGDGKADLGCILKSAGEARIATGQASGAFSSIAISSGSFPSTQHFENQNSNGNEFVIEKPSWRRLGCEAQGCSFEQPTFSFQFGSAGSGNGQFAYPGAPSLDAEGNIWVTDAFNNRLEKFDPEGKYLTQFGTKGSGNGQLNTAVGTAIDSEGDIWVADLLNNRVQQFNSKGEYLSKFGIEGSGDGQLKEPGCLAIDAEGNIWVTDRGNNRVQKFDPEGKYLDQFGTKGLGNGQLNTPGGIAIDPEGDIWVVDTDNNRVQKFDPEGNYLLQVGGKGSGEGQLSAPLDIDIGPNGRVWVTDSGNSRVQQFNAKGGFLTQFGTKGAGEGQFEAPAGIAVDAEGGIWVTDVVNLRIEKWVVG